MQYLSVAGLLVISAAWLMQYFHMKKGNQGIVGNFVLANCLGIFMLVLDAFSSGAYEIAVANVLVLLCSLLVFTRIGKSA